MGQNLDLGGFTRSSLFEQEISANIGYVLTRHGDSPISQGGHAKRALATKVHAEIELAHDAILAPLLLQGQRMSEYPTHRQVPAPRMGVRYLADYMAASERGKRRIVLNSKFRPLAKVIQHAEAVRTVSKFIRGGDHDIGWLQQEAERLRGRMADDDFERDLLDHNADYIARFADVVGGIKLPKADLLPPGPSGAIDIHGVRVSVGLHFRLRRLTKTNKVREGAAMLRYAKGKKLLPEAGGWQAAFLLGYLRDTSVDQNIDPDRGLCLTIDAYAGVYYPGPTDSVSRYQNMKAACQSIAERWPNIQPPPGAIL